MVKEKNNKMTPIEKVRSYAYKYLSGAYIIDGGFCKWIVHATKEQKAMIAKKAILEGMYVGFENVIPQYGEKVREMYLTY